MYQVGNVKISVKADIKDYPRYLSAYLNIPLRKLRNVTLLKRSIDARKKAVMYRCSFAFDLDEKRGDLREYQPYRFTVPGPVKKLTVVIGSGPAGMFCAWLLAKSGSPVILLERGKPVDQRILDVEKFFLEGVLNEQSNIQFGEGGAGTFSDGKLTSGIKDEKKRLVLETFVKYGAPEDILYEAMPHIGTDHLRKIMPAMRQDIIKMGGQVRFSSCLTDIFIEHQRLTGIEINHQERLSCDALVLAIGHSARDTFHMLAERNIPLTGKPFAVGLRVEHRQRVINETQYGAAFRYLKPASYKATDGRGVYTFCMCPGGQVIAAASEEGHLVVNGMSDYDRQQDNGNSAVVVGISKGDPFAGIAYQRELEQKAFVLGGGDFRAPVMTVGDYLHERLTGLGDIVPSYRPGVRLANLAELFDDEINDKLRSGLVTFGKKLPFFQDEQAVLTGVESRSSSPVRILRDSHYQSPIVGIYPCGEGAGYAGGIMSAAVDGLNVALEILKS